MPNTPKIRVEVMESTGSVFLTAESGDGDIAVTYLLPREADELRKALRKSNAGKGETVVSLY